jgi:hypothetical protein
MDGHVMDIKIIKITLALPYCILRVTVVNDHWQSS